MERSAVCVFVGALVGAAATYGVMKNKDKIVEKFEALEDYWCLFDKNDSIRLVEI